MARRFTRLNPDNTVPVYEDERAEGAFSRGWFILPVAPFGDPKMDGGERWDLKVLSSAPAPSPSDLTLSIFIPGQVHG
jgi:hypothetical protein